MRTLSLLRWYPPFTRLLPRRRRDAVRVYWIVSSVTTTTTTTLEFDERPRQQCSLCRPHRRRQHHLRQHQHTSTHRAKSRAAKRNCDGSPRQCKRFKRGRIIIQKVKRQQQLKVSMALQLLRMQLRLRLLRLQHLILLLLIRTCWCTP